MGTDASSQSTKKPFREMFWRDELCYYTVAAVVYIVLGILFLDLVLNWIVGPLFIVMWVWAVPALVDKWRAHRK